MNKLEFSQKMVIYYLWQNNSFAAFSTRSFIWNIVNAVLLTDLPIFIIVPNSHPRVPLVNQYLDRSERSETYKYSLGFEEGI